MTEANEPKEYLDQIDKRIKDHYEGIETVKFSWKDHDPFQFYFLLVGFERDKLDGRLYMLGHAKGANQIEGEESSGPFAKTMWSEIKLPIATKICIYLHKFAEMKKLENPSQFQNQVFFISYNGVDYHDCPHKGKQRVYDFGVELIEEDGTILRADDV